MQNKIRKVLTWFRELFSSEVVIHTDSGVRIIVRSNYPYGASWRMHPDDLRKFIASPKVQAQVAAARRIQINNSPKS